MTILNFTKILDNFKAKIYKTSMLDIIKFAQKSNYINYQKKIKNEGWASFKKR